MKTALVVGLILICAGLYSAHELLDFLAPIHERHGKVVAKSFDEVGGKVRYIEWRVNVQMDNGSVETWTGSFQAWKRLSVGDMVSDSRRQIFTR